MSRTTNTVPYTNARRSGRTSPGLVEIIEPGDPRWNNHHSAGAKYSNGRAARRKAGGYRGIPIRKSAAAVKLYRPEPCQPHRRSPRQDPHTWAISQPFPRAGQLVVVVRCTKCGQSSYRAANTITREG